MQLGYFSFKKNKNIIFCLFAPFIVNALMAQEPSPYFKLFLIGDAGKDTGQSAAIKLLESEIKKDQNSAVVFLGDNVYPNGICLDKKNPEVINVSMQKMISQLEIFKNYHGQVYMVPGNHDWDKCNWNGINQVKDEAFFVEKYMKENTKIENINTGVFFPLDAMPGPVSKLLKPGIRLVLIDTQWWLQQQFFHPVGHIKGMSNKETSDRFFHNLDSILAAAKSSNEKVIIVGHHPLYSKGKHALKKQPWRFLINYTPFQIFGLLGLNRVYMQDTEQPRYKRMKRMLLESMDPYANIIYACGHDHNMQFSKHENLYHIVSGSGSMHSKLTKDREILFTNKNQLGYFKLSFYKSGKILVEAMGTAINDVLYQYEINQ
jgi:predicted phosphodiesterase